MDTGTKIYAYKILANWILDCIKTNLSWLSTFLSQEWYDCSEIRTSTHLIHHIEELSVL